MGILRDNIGWHASATITEVRKNMREIYLGCMIGQKGKVYIQEK